MNHSSATSRTQPDTSVAGGSEYGVQPSSYRTKLQQSSTQQQVSNEHKSLIVTVDNDNHITTTTSIVTNSRHRNSNEHRIRSWLRSLRLHVITSLENGYLLCDPYRNGVLLSDLASLLIPGCRCAVYVQRNPTTLTEARANYRAAIDAFAPHVTLPLPAGLLMAELMAGNRELLWSFLYLLLETFQPDLANRRSIFWLSLFHGVEDKLREMIGVDVASDFNELSGAEALVLCWIRSLHIYTGPPTVTNPNSYPYDDADLPSLLADFSSGELLCDLVGYTQAGPAIERERLMAQKRRDDEHHRLIVAAQSDRRFQRMAMNGPPSVKDIPAPQPLSFIGVQRQPKTVKLRRANIDKAITLLLPRSKMSKHWLSSVHRICDGDRRVIMALLYDLYRWDCSLSPLNASDFEAALGDTATSYQPALPLPTSSSLATALVPSSSSSPPPQPPTTEPTVPPTAPAAPTSTTSQIPTRRVTSTTSNKPPAANTSASTMSNSTKRTPIPANTEGETKRSGGPSITANGINHVPVKPTTPATAASTSSPMPKTNNEINEDDSDEHGGNDGIDGKHEGSAAPAGVPLAASASISDSTLLRECASLYKWLHSFDSRLIRQRVASLAVMLTDQERQRTDIANFLHQNHMECDDGSIWSDGLILCQLVQRLPGMSSVTLRGIESAPHSRAQCLHNVNQALVILRQQRKMPLTWLWSAHDIVDGDRLIARKLLIHLRTLWPSSTTRSTKKRPSTTASHTASGKSS